MSAEGLRASLHGLLYRTARVAAVFTHNTGSRELRVKLYAFHGLASEVTVNSALVSWSPRPAGSPWAETTEGREYQEKGPWASGG